MKCCVARRKFLIAGLVLTALATWNSTVVAQIVGIVTNVKNGKPLVGAEVFINKSTSAGSTGIDGRFEIAIPAHGFVDLVLHKEGFQLYRSTMRTQAGRSYNLELSLTPSKRREKNTNRLIQDNYEFGYRKISYLEEGSRQVFRLEQMPADSLRQSIYWEQNRHAIYRGSLRHFLTALAAGSSALEGFEIRSGGKEVDLGDIVQATPQPDYFQFFAEAPLEISHHQDASVSMSAILTKGRNVNFNDEGMLLDEESLIVEGVMADKLLQKLPLDYVPIEGDVEEAYRETLFRFYEKVYVHTDKPYYYQGEPMWFKAYLSYYYPAWRDSLSKVLYVELISPRKEIILEKMLKIENGSAHGDFILPDTLKRGDYYLRAYTNLQRNFGDENLNVKHIPVLGITDKVDPILGEWDSLSNELIRVESEKPTYSTREKIVLKISKQELGAIRNSFSISVTDAQQVVPVNWESNTSNFLKTPIIEISKMGIDFLTERGLRIEGRCTSLVGKSVKAPFALVDLKTKQLYTGNTDENGTFVLYDLEYYDSTSFNFKSLDKKRQISKVTITYRKKPEISINGNNQQITSSLIETQTPQRLISEYEVPEGDLLLDDVVVTSNRLSSVREERPYGQVSDVNIIKEKDINASYGDLNYSLVGKIPGLQLQQGPGGEWDVKIVRSKGLSLNSGGEPLVTINDVPMLGSSAGAIISMVDPNTVKSVEVSKGLNPLYGSQGAYGVIAIYTKDGSNIVNRAEQDVVTMVKLMGYPSPRLFKSPDHSLQNDAIDFRSTLYWNPSMEIQDSETVTFYASDLKGPYRVELVGVNEEGDILKNVFFLSIR